MQHHPSQHAVALLAASMVLWVSEESAQSCFCYPSCCFDIEAYLPGGTVGQPYEGWFCALPCDTSFASWSITGALPPGLSTSYRPGCYGAPYIYDLVVSGTPTTPGTFSFSVTVSDSPYCGETIPCEIQIDPAACTTITSNLPACFRGVPYSGSFTASGGTPPYRFEALGTLPPGLRLASWGALFGTPSAAGTFNFDVKASDSAGCVVTQPFTLTVQCPSINLEPSAIPTATAGTPYQQQFTADGVAPHTFAIAGGALPTGLGLSSAGELTGTPTQAGDAAFEVEATDAQGCSGWRTYQLRVRGFFDNLAGMAGMPNRNRARIITTAGGTAVDLDAYSAGQWGVEATAGDVDNALYDVLLTGPGPGPSLGPHTRGFDRFGASLPRINFFAYGTLKYGVHPGAGNIDADSYEEIVTGAGSGTPFGPHVRGFDVDGAVARAITGASFFAYSTQHYGVQVACGDVDSDGRAEILTGPGPGPAFGPTVRGFRYTGSVHAISAMNFDAFSGARYGARVSAGDVDSDAREEIAVAHGPGPTEPAQVRGFELENAALRGLPGFDITHFATMFGASVATGDQDHDNQADLLVAAGPDPAADTRLRTYTYSGASLDPLPQQSLTFPGASYGVNVGSGQFAQ